MRKEAGFEVMDKITVYAEGSDKATGLMNANADSIKSDVMADALVTGSVDGYSKEWNINGEKVTLGVKEKRINKYRALTDAEKSKFILAFFGKRLYYR